MYISIIHVYNFFAISTVEEIRNTEIFCCRHCMSKMLPQMESTGHFIYLGNLILCCK